MTNSPYVPETALNRREAIGKALILLFAAALPASAQPAIQPVDSAAVIAAVAEATIPGDDAPGAREANVPRFIESVIQTHLPEAAAAQWKHGLDAISTALAGNPLHRHPVILTELEHSLSRDTPASQVLTLLKQLTVIGFCTSETGAKALFFHDPVPGDYHRAPVDDDFRTTYLSFGPSPADLAKAIGR